MPTIIVYRRKASRDLFFLFAFAVGFSFFVIEVVDPAPMDVAAAVSVASP